MVLAVYEFFSSQSGSFPRRRTFPPSYLNVCVVPRGHGFVPQNVGFVGTGRAWGILNFLSMLASCWILWISPAQEEACLSWSSLRVSYLPNHPKGGFIKFSLRGLPRDWRTLLFCSAVSYVTQMLLKAPLGRVIKLDTWGQAPLSMPSPELWPRWKGGIC